MLTTQEKKNKKPKMPDSKDNSRGKKVVDEWFDAAIKRSTPSGTISPDSENGEKDECQPLEDKK